MFVLYGKNLSSKYGAKWNEVQRQKGAPLPAYNFLTTNLLLRKQHFGLKKKKEYLKL